MVKFQLSNSMVIVKIFQHSSLELPGVAEQLRKGACLFAKLGHSAKQKDGVHGHSVAGSTTVKKMQYHTERVGNTEDQEH